MADANQKPLTKVQKVGRIFLYLSGAAFLIGIGPYLLMLLLMATRSAAAIRRPPVGVNHPGSRDHCGHRLTMPPVWEYSRCHHRIHPELLLPVYRPKVSLFVLFFNFRRRHGLREGQR
jgi:hypothetical protein